MNISMKTVKTLVIAVLAVVVVWLGKMVLFPGQPRTDTPVNDGQHTMGPMAMGMGSGLELNDGQTIFKAKCAMCHGADGSGNTPIGKEWKMPDLRSADVQKKSDDQLFRIIAHGKEPMPAFEESLGDAKIHQVIAYVRQLGKKR